MVNRKINWTRRTLNMEKNRKVSFVLSESFFSLPFVHSFFLLGIVSISLLSNFNKSRNRRNGITAIEWKCLQMKRENESTRKVNQENFVSHTHTSSWRLEIDVCLTPCRIWRARLAAECSCFFHRSKTEKSETKCSMRLKMHRNAVFNLKCKMLIRQRIPINELVRLCSPNDSRRQAHKRSFIATRRNKVTLFSPVLSVSLLEMFCTNRAYEMGYHLQYFSI